MSFLFLDKHPDLVYLCTDHLFNFSIMKQIKLFLCILGSLIIISTFGQKPVEETSWDKLSELFLSMDQIGLSIDSEQGSGTENIHWMRLTKVYHKDCDLKMDYIADRQQNISASCTISISKVKPDDLKYFDLSGIPCLKLELSGEDILLFDDVKNNTGKSNTIFFRACYDKSTYNELKSAIKEVRKSCEK